jgi:hypothetical protein
VISAGNRRASEVSVGGTFTRLFAWPCRADARPPNIGCASGHTPTLSPPASDVNPIKLCVTGYHRISSPMALISRAS